MHNHLDDRSCSNITAPSHGQEASCSSFLLARELLRRIVRRGALIRGPNCKFGKHQLARQAKFAQNTAPFLHKKGPNFCIKRGPILGPKNGSIFGPSKFVPNINIISKPSRGPKIGPQSGLKNEAAKRTKITSRRHRPVLCRSASMALLPHGLHVGHRHALTRPRA